MVPLDHHHGHTKEMTENEKEEKMRASPVPEGMEDIPL
jgi:hypothetical protein